MNELPFQLLETSHVILLSPDKDITLYSGLGEWKYNCEIFILFYMTLIPFKLIWSSSVLLNKELLSNLQLESIYNVNFTKWEYLC